MSNAESWDHQSESFERFPSERLVAYLQGQFADAAEKENAENRRGEYASHGSFVQHVPVELEHALTRGADRIVMKPPHPYDSPGVYCEIFAILPFRPDSYEMNEDTAGLTSRFIIREFEDNEPGPWQLIDDNGVHLVDVDRIEFLEATATDPLLPIGRAEELLSKISTYNIVAVKE